MIYITKGGTGAIGLHRLDWPSKLVHGQGYDGSGAQQWAARNTEETWPVGSSRGGTESKMEGLPSVARDSMSGVKFEKRGVETEENRKERKREKESGKDTVEIHASENKYIFL